jgi:hypothetical protein
MPNPLNTETASEQSDNLLFRKVVPSGLISVTETRQKVCTLGLQHSVDSSDEGRSIPRFYVVKTSHIKDKLEPLIFEGKPQKNSYQKVHVNFFFAYSFFGEFHRSV